MLYVLYMLYYINIINIYFLFVFILGPIFFKVKIISLKK